MAVYTTIEAVKPKPHNGSFDEGLITLRDEQEEAIRMAMKYFKGHKKNAKFLWNAKMRFGKTLSALELAKRMGALEGDSRVKRTIIVTHRPVVNDSWKEDFSKIFGEDCTTYHYGTKFDDSAEGDFYALERAVAQGKHYIFFASMQYLRRSTLVGGDNEEQLKKDILMADWDLVVIDEAHEGTRTNLGQLVINLLTQHEHTKALHLSGTPFNLYEDFEQDQIYTWDYIKEQTAKRQWGKLHPNEPAEANPYRELPDMEIRTYDLGKLIKADLGADASFQFKEFFRTYQGQKVDADKKGRFVHEEEVRQFLDLMCTEDEESHYPFSTEEYQTFFNHTLWVVPGVKEAKALERLLREHDVFGGFDAIINVAGNGDDETRQDALDKVKQKIGKKPEQTYTITISCGRLTTGVTVRPWTAVFYLKGSENTSAATYMQTIFRVQSPYTYVDENGDTRMKTKCYVFDFAPDRTLKMVAETAKFATLTQKEKNYAAAATTREKDIENMEGFLQFCPVIAMEGGRMVEYHAERLFEQLEHVYVDRVVRNGFNDNSLYDIRELMNLAPDEVKDLDAMGQEIGKTTNMEKPKRATNIDVAGNGLTAKQKAAAERAKKKQREGKELTAEEQEALEAEKKRKAEERKERDNRITILRGISLRIPLMMYGAQIDDEEEGITLKNFTKIIDDASWAEFMPNVSKAQFNKYRKCYNATVFVAAGKRYRQLAREADRMPVDERVRRISDIFSYFHNPDKETVLTPWRVVNMHMSDCLGGYTFFNERFDGPVEKAIPSANGELFEWVQTLEPRFVDRGDVTREVFATNTKILEINSKTGLYPLYVAYSLFRQRKKDFELNGLIDDPDNYSVEEEQVIWDDILSNNIYVICNTPMARRITMRTLLGFRQLTQRDGTEQINVKSEKLISRASDDREALIRDLQSVGYWRGNKRNKEMIKFGAVVGNPPYQVNIGKEKDNYGVLIFGKFIQIGKALNPNLLSMIVPSRWFTGGRGLDAFRQEMLSDRRLCYIHDFADSKDLFPTVDISGGINYFLWKVDYDGLCDFITESVQGIQHAKIDLSKNDILSRHLYADSIIEKVQAIASDFIDQFVSGQTPFGLITTFKGDKVAKAESIILHTSRGIEYILPNQVLANAEIIDKYKVTISNATAEHAGIPDKNGMFRIMSNLRIMNPNEVCTQSYRVVKSFDNNNEAQSCMNYLKTRFVRILMLPTLASQHISKETFRFVPLQDFTPSSDIDWSASVSDIDRQLYRKYGLSDDEVAFIEKMIKPME